MRYVAMAGGFLIADTFLALVLHGAFAFVAWNWKWEWIDGEMMPIARMSFLFLWLFGVLGISALFAWAIIESSDAMESGE